MDRKYITFLLFNLLAFLPFTATAAGDEFPFEGGTTSDGIIVTKPQSSSFQKLKDLNTYQVKSDESECEMTFSVTVPKGKTAYLRFGLILNLIPNDGDIRSIDRSSVNFKVKLDGKPIIHHHNTTSIATQSDFVTIPEGIHKVVFTAEYDAEEAKLQAAVENLSIHIHRFNKEELASEPLCGETATKTSKCVVCGKLSFVTVTPKSKKHLMKVSQSRRGSCMATARVDSVCEYCPLKITCLKGKREEHEFKNGTCSVCGLHMPTCNGDSTMFTINNAGELRILSELMSIGRIPGNIGIDIRADLEFNESVTMMPLGTYDHPFQGTLNGNGHRVFGVSDFKEGTDCLGIVGVAKGTLASHAVIANLIFDRGNTMCGQACVGAIAGYAEYCDITNCANFATLEGNDYVGGIVGYAGQQVSIANCASVGTLRTIGKWNPIACGMPLGHVLNSYGACFNDYGGTLDELPTTTLRHCFATLGSGLTIITDNMLPAYDMVEKLNEESDQPSFEMSQRYNCPVPVVNSKVVAMSNRALPVSHNPMWRRAASEESGDDSNGGDDYDNGKAIELVVTGGYVNESSPARYFKKIDEVMHEDSLLYPDFERTYIITRKAPDNAKLYEPSSDGQMIAFSSFLIPADTTYISYKEYDILSSDTVMAMTETVFYKEHIDEYNIVEGTYTLKSRITFEKDYDIVCQENVDGILKRIWSIETLYDSLDMAKVTNGYSHNYRTGESTLEYSRNYSHDKDNDDDDDEGIYKEYQEGDSIHVIYTYEGSDDKNPYRSHYIFRASDQNILDWRTEELVNGEVYLRDGIYFVYNDEGSLLQSVSYGPVVDNQLGGEMRPYLYYEYKGSWQSNLFPTAIEIPTVKQPSAQQRIDHHVYNLQGRMMRTVTDAKDPFSGLPKGIYIYQGKKYFKR